MVTYHEHILKKKKSAKDLVFCLITPFVVAILAFILMLVCLSTQVLSVFVPAIFIGGIYLSYKLISSKNVEFEYLLVDSDLDIDKIINKTRRKRIASIYRKEIIALAPMGSSNLPENWETLPKTDASVYPEHPDTYVLVYNHDGIQKVLYFCPTEKMLEVMTIRNPRKVFKD